MIEIVAWHASAERTLVVRSGLHVGTHAQARMRGAPYLHRLVLRISGRMPRLRDKGTWNSTNLARHARRAQAAVYLNRHEGIPIGEFETARGSIDLDEVTDRLFRRHVPSAADSWIVLDPSIVETVERVDRDADRTSIR